MDFPFDTFEQARDWAKAKPGRTIKPAATVGFIGREAQQNSGRTETQFDYSALQGKALSTLFKNVAHAFYSSVNYLTPNPATPEQIDLYVSRLDLQQLLVLEAVLNFDAKAAKEIWEAGYGNRDDAQAKKCMFQEVNQLRMLARKEACPGLIDHSLVKPDFGTSDGDSAYLSDGMWVSADGKITDEGA